MCVCFIYRLLQTSIWIAKSYMCKQMSLVVVDGRRIVFSKVGTLLLCLYGVWWIFFFCRNVCCVSKSFWDISLFLCTQICVRLRGYLLLCGFENWVTYGLWWCTFLETNKICIFEWVLTWHCLVMEYWFTVRFCNKSWIFTAMYYVPQAS